MTGKARVFVTGTGTDIGKTYVAAGLVRALRRAGRQVRALKPLASGFDPARAAESDAAMLLDALGGQGAIEDISPWRFRAPLSPDMAAALEGRRIDFDALVAYSVNPSGDAVAVVEGVGGVMAPVGERHTVLDWMAALDWPVIMVCGAYLGAISHTLTAVDAVQRRGLTVAAIVVNEFGDSIGLDLTMAALSRFTAAPLLPLPCNAQPDAFDRIAALIA